MARAAGAIIVKKYGNRRLYDTEASRYLTQDELADRIREGEDVVVIDAKTGDDLTQGTLAQIIMESRGGSKLLPVPLLTQLIRLGDEALAEFFGRYMSASLDMYLQARRNAEALSSINPFATLPFQAGSALARVFMPNGAEATPAPGPVPNGNGSASGAAEDVDELRREIAELKEAVRSGLAQQTSTRKKKTPKTKKRKKSKKTRTTRKKKKS